MICWVEAGSVSPSRCSAGTNTALATTTRAKARKPFKPQCLGKNCQVDRLQFGCFPGAQGTSQNICLFEMLLELQESSHLMLCDYECASCTLQSMYCYK